MERYFDARGMACPLPVVNAKKQAEMLKAGDSLVVAVDNEIAVQNLKRFAQHKGFAVKAEKKGEGDFAVTMEITQNGAQTAQAELCCGADTIQKGLVVVLSSDKMGSGSEKLGTALMKSFVFALTKQDILPETVVCYNSGAFLSCEGADTLEDLKLLEAEGVKVFTCGTCLDFYGIKDKLSVGSVTNMYEIVQLMEGAEKIVKP